MGELRIVGGALRGRRLRVPDRGVRPTSERVREAIFDILGPAWVEGARVLDLFAGTGALGIEALSRGAAEVVFVERDPAVARALRERIAALGLEGRGRVVIASAAPEAAAPHLAGRWNLVFLDPPYDTGAGEAWLPRLAAWTWPEDGGMVIYERRSGPAVPAPPGLALAVERAYGETTVSLYRAGGRSAAPERGAT
jgi:16S rRNA (guanine966-N2)-methyltransferase